MRSAEPALRALCAGAVLLGSIACRSASPADALAAYRDALARRDGPALWRLSDGATRSATAAVGLLDLPAPVLSGEPIFEERAVATFPDGHRVALVREDGEWRVASGGLEPCRTDRPAPALACLLWAAEARRWSLVRRLMPRRYAQDLATDEALAAHLSSMAPRLAAARQALAPLATWPVVEEGDRAQLDYGGQRRVRFERELGQWKVVDLE